VVSLALHYQGLWMLLLGRPTLVTGSEPVVFAKTALITAAVTTLVWIAVTMATRPENEAVLVRFYRKAQPDVRGWGPVARQAGDITPTRDLGRNVTAWVLGCGMVYLALFGTGKLLLREPELGALLLAGAVVCAALLYRHMSRGMWTPSAGLEGRTTPAGEDGSRARGFLS
jgi:hypothetical protein